MDSVQRFAEAIKRIDHANSEDPRTDIVAGKPQARELLFAMRVYEWVRKLTDEPSEELLLAARAHTLKRWLIPRDRYPKTTLGYHQWRDALAQLHANEAESILRGVGYADDEIQKVRSFIVKSNWPEDVEACALEDSDCLVFLETKLRRYIDTWEETDTIRILERTFRKMTQAGRAHALKLQMGDRELALLRQAKLAADSGT